LSSEKLPGSRISVLTGRQTKPSQRRVVWFAARAAHSGEKEEIVSPTILIVDEDVNAQIIAETLLRLREFGVRVARDGTEACDILRHEDIAVVVLDASVPGMNAFELLRRLRGRFGPLPLATKPRILVVADRQEPEVERFALRLGADAFLRKPLAPAQFIKSVQELAEGAAPQAA